MSPFWYGARSATEIVVDENAPTDAAEDFVDEARDSVASFVPSIRDEMAAGGMAAVIANPTTRQRHIDTILEFADDVGADGIDLDYEQFAFSDGDATWATTSPNWVTFVRELADGAARRRAHADGQHPAGVRPGGRRRQRLLGVRTGHDRRVRRRDPDHGLRLLGRRARPDRPAGVGAAGGRRRVEGGARAVPRQARARRAGLRRQLGDGDDAARARPAPRARRRSTPATCSTSRPGAARRPSTTRPRASGRSPTT